jgi:hypothetical protein
VRIQLRKPSTCSLQGISFGSARVSTSRKRLIGSRATGRASGELIVLDPGDAPLSEDQPLGSLAMPVQVQGDLECATAPP